MKPTLNSLSPNLIAANVNRSVDFYTRELGFTLVASVPETGTYNWAMVQRDTVTMMFQTLESIHEDMPSLKITGKGSIGTFFIKMKGIDQLLADLKGKVEIPLDMRTTFYGMKEFAVKDPDGYLLVFAEDM
jgi:catechol 2,3-dioxygenase-like lactoylglutathione lyase family enzyme